ncbi:glycine cleavage system protein H [Nocardia sp. NBC_00881]|uniref:glycine cleavage system protein H n=1 Tax=Nocardia sp. NBC_00881 TaxID=2975995 RepID=UPI00386E630C|nr:glycine cleavage system protein H [Nocardia sp. NBC_00881]
MRAQQIPTDRRYTAGHSWLALAPGDHLADYPIRCGVAKAAVEGVDVVALDLPAVRSTVMIGAPCALIWTSARSAITLAAPITGLVTLANTAVVDDPRLVAADPFHAGWLFAVLPTLTASTAGLLTAAQYANGLGAAT